MKPDQKIFSVEHIGGKARNLLLLQERGYPVPPFIVLPASELSTCKNESELKAILNSRMEVFGPGRNYFAVRSSYSAEDGKELSFAGQFLSELFVSESQLPEAVWKVLNSVHSGRIRTYIGDHPMPATQNMSVIIQEMIPAEVSGVAFSMDPLSGHRTKRMINSVFGLGEGLVSGDISADQFSLFDDTIEQQVNYKSHAWRFDPTSEQIQRQTLGKEGYSASLTEDQVREIGLLSSRISNDLGAYADVEFCYFEGKSFILQARPVTAFRSTPDAGGKHIVWDNSNIIESYPGLTLPLTFSYIIDLYERAYIQFLSVLGVDRASIAQNFHYFANMLGILNGRVYYNLRSWYKMISLLPGYRLNARFMEQMMGVKERFDLGDTRLISRLRDWLRLGKMSLSILANFITLERQKRRFMAQFDALEADYRKLDPYSLSIDRIMDEYLRREKLILRIWKAPLINDFFAMIYFGLLKKQLSNLFGEEEHRYNDLFIGGKEIITAEPARLISEMVGLITANRELNTLFAEHNSGFIAKELTQNTELREFKALFESYLRVFGDRVVGELKLETITYRQEPKLLLEILQAYIRGKIKLPGIQDRLNAGETEKELWKKLRSNPLKKMFLKHILRQARKLVSARENLRLYRTRAFAGARDTFCRIGEILQMEGLIEEPRDIFYLRKPEIFQYLSGTSVDTDLKGLIALRKQEYERYRVNGNQSERINTFGGVYVGNSFFRDQMPTTEAGDLQGTGCCRGIVRGSVRLVSRPEDAFELSGDILVAATTDPGWVTIFPSVKGVIVERGSLLSHVAIVAREMGLPCIVRVQGASEKLKNGEMVEMDGSTGTVKRISNGD